MSHWKYKGKVLDTMPEGYFGFVYEIENVKTGMKYIGREYFMSTRRKPLTKKQKKSGRKRRTIVRKETDWKTYTGSNNELNEYIEKNGLSDLKFTILALGKTKGQVNFLEETFQHKRDALLRDDYYNESIGPRRYMNMKKNQSLLNEIKNNE